jgi:hypothetical protein
MMSTSTCFSAGVLSSGSLQTCDFFSFSRRPDDVMPVPKYVGVDTMNCILSVELVSSYIQTARCIHLWICKVGTGRQKTQRVRFLRRITMR